MEYVYRTTEQRVDAELKSPTETLPWEVATVEYDRRGGFDTQCFIVVWRVPKSEVLLEEARRETTLTGLVHQAMSYLIGALAMKINYPKRADQIKTRVDCEIPHVRPQNEPERWGLDLIRRCQLELKHLCPEGRPIDTKEDREELLQELLQRVVFPKKGEPAK